MAATIVNPFGFETPADRWSFTDREDLIPRIRSILESPGRRALVHGRRRMGKTSLITFAAARAKTPFAFVDLSTAADLNEVARRLLASLPLQEESLGPKLRGLLARHVSRIGLTARGFTLATDLRVPAPESLDQVLAFLDDYAGTTDVPLAILLDEFQDIRRLGGDQAEWRLRGTIQHQRHLSYLFAGSDHRLVQWMTEPQAAFFKQLDLIEVGPIEPGLLASWIDARTRRGGLIVPPFGAAVVATAGPCTGDVVRLAKQTFDLAAAHRRGDPALRAMDLISLEYLTPEFGTIWRPLPHSQRMLLRAIAAGHAPFAQSTFTAFSLTVGGVGTALTALFDKQILIRVGETVHFDNPFFRHWVAANGVGG